MRQSVSVLVVLSCETLDVILASRNWALFRTFVLVGQHVCFQILEHLAAFWMRASLLLLGVAVAVSGMEGVHAWPPLINCAVSWEVVLVGGWKERALTPGPHVWW